MAISLVLPGDRSSSSSLQDGKTEPRQTVRAKTKSEALWHWAVALQRRCLHQWMLTHCVYVRSRSFLHLRQLKMFQSMLQQWSVVATIRRQELTLIIHAATAVQRRFLIAWKQLWLVKRARVKRTALQTLRLHVARNIRRRNFNALAAAVFIRCLSNVLCAWRECMVKALDANAETCRHLCRRRESRSSFQVLCFWRCVAEAQVQRQAKIGAWQRRVALRRALQQWQGDVRLGCRSWMLRAHQFNCQRVMRNSVRSWMLWFVHQRGKVVRANLLQGRLAQLKGPKAIRRWHNTAKTLRTLRSARKVLMRSHKQRVMLPVVVAWRRYASKRRDKRLRQGRARGLFNAAVQRLAIREVVAVADHQLLQRAANAAEAKKRVVLEVQSFFRHWVILVHAAEGRPAALG